MNSSSPDLEFQTSPDEKSWNIEGQIGQTTAAAATLDLENDEDGMHTFSKFPDSAVDIEEDEADTSELINRKKHPAWSFAYYQEFFDVDTSTVLQRVKGSMIPLPRGGFSRTYIKGKPDMYGPFWICATLVLCIGVCGNLSTLLTNFSQPGYVYKAQFELLPIAAIIIYCYAFLLPLLIKGFFAWRKTSSGFSISQIICTYGYSMFIFIPASFLFIVPYAAFDWAVLAIGVALSGAVILISLWPAFENDSKQVAAIALAVLFVIHCVVMVCIKQYFFSPGDSNSPSNSSTLTTSVISSRSTDLVTSLSGAPAGKADA